MTVERALRMTGGVLVLVSFLLGHFVSPCWFLFTAFLALNLIHSGFAVWCPSMTIRWHFGPKAS